MRGYGIIGSEGIDDTKDIDNISNKNRSDVSNTVYNCYHLNEHGDTELITGEAGQVNNAYFYDVFGGIRTSKERIKNRYTYNGEQYYKISEQYYLRARYYNPALARFTQEDEYRGDGLNLYAYVGNNPVMYVDPSGYAKKCGTGTKKEKNKPDDGDISNPNKNAEIGDVDNKGGSQATKDLYRAVSPEEFDDIISTNSFRGIEGKTLGAKEFG
ncbi:MAG: RHS repeat-associated core domain-containing protein, partial [Clostridiales bacterium]|nr:RHS repeat-associated core domain-containing protein [Clostridiales bacterium]